MMRYIKAKCTNEDCVTAGDEVTLPAGILVAEGIMERYGPLECTVCGGDITIERV